MIPKSYGGAFCATLLILHGAFPCQAQAQKEAPAPTTSVAQRYFTDVALVNHDGQQMRFYSDLIRAKVVIVNVFFADCTGVCPPMLKTLEKIQDWLGSRLGKEVHILSITVDSARDTPPHLKELARKFNAKPGWFFLSGKKENVAFALKKLGQHVEAREDHSNILIIGNEPTGLWKKAFGLAKTEDLIKIIEGVLSDKGVAAK